jgi:hypothetical protein
MKIVKADEYQKALEEISISEKQKLMLEAHYKAINKSITYTDLASSAGYDDFTVANSQYGKLGRLIGEAVGFEFVNLDKDGDRKFYSSSIGMPNSYTEGDFQLVMHHELAKAIKKSGVLKD